MANLINSMIKDGVIQPPSWLPDNTCYLTIMGSEAYGCADQVVLKSDKDIYGFCVPPKEIVFPHLSGEIFGFHDEAPRFDQWQQHGVEWNSKNYDFSVYNIVKYFALCADCNPNMLDSLFTPRECLLQSSSIAEMVRENRQLFLSKKAYHRFKGYGYSQLHKAKSTERTGKRKEIYERFNCDVKFLYHVVRLMYEVEQILTEHDIDMRRHAEEYKAIRRGERTLEDVQQLFTQKERYLEELYQKSTLPHSPQWGKIKALLINCLEHHYGNLSNVIVKNESEAERKLAEIRRILQG